MLYFEILPHTDGARCRSPADYMRHGPRLRCHKTDNRAPVRLVRSKWWIAKLEESPIRPLVGAGFAIGS